MTQDNTAASEKHNELVAIVVKDHFNQLLGDNPSDGLVDLLIYVESIITAAVMLANKMGVPADVMLHELMNGVKVRLLEALNG